MSQIKALDGLRGIAALIVVIGHFNLVVPRFLHGGAADSGHAGVMIFFVLSGYLMGLLYLGQPPGRQAAAQFLVRRAARVLPLYFAVVFASVAVGALGPDRAWTYDMARWDTLLSHLLLIRGEGVLWTVPLEMQFYLLVPLIWLGHAKAPRAALAALLGAIALAYLARMIVTPPLQSFMARLMVGVPFFLAGLVLSRCVRPAVGGRRWDALFVAAMGGILLLYPKVVPAETLGVKDHWFSPVSLVPVSLLLFASLRSRLAERVLGSRPLRFLGRISYGIYLLHFVVISNLIRFTPLHPRAYALFALSLALTIATAYLAHVLIERPARDAINRWFDRRRDPAQDQRREPTFERVP